VRERLKQLAFGVATLLAVPALVSFHLRRTILGGDRALEGSTETLSLLPGLVGDYVRRAFLARALAQCDRSVTVRFGTLFSQSSARIGENVYIGPRCHIGLAHIERDVLIGAGVHIPSGAATHGTSEVTTPIREQSGHRTIVRIGEGSWIGSNAVVMADIGRNVVIGAGAIVTTPIPDYAIAVGVPARVVRDRRQTREARTGTF
jgi:virginiamycin A acetyltransferase